MGIRKYSTHFQCDTELTENVFGEKGEGFIGTTIKDTWTKTRGWT